MDNTTRRDIFPPNFDSPSWNGRTDSPTPGLSRPSIAIRAVDQPAGAAGSRASLGTTEATSATQMTYASKLPPDHPGLQLEKPKARTLRNGPVLTSVGILGIFVGIALIVALSPRSDRARAAPLAPDTPTKDIALPDAVRDAPGNNAYLHQVPRLGPPKPDATASTHHGAAYSNSHQSIREEHAKGLGSPILVDVENPVVAEQNSPSGSTPATTPMGVTSPATTAAALPPSSSLLADPNMQQHKVDFLSRDGVNNATYLSDQLSAPQSPYEVKAGTVIPTTLITGINSDLPGQIVGQVRENVHDTVTGNYLLIPQGSRLLATYDSSVTFGQERVLVCWNRLVRPDGMSISLQCMPGVDLSGYAGVADDIDHHWFRIVSGVALGTLLSTTAQRSQGDVTGFNPTLPQLWASNAGGALNQAGQQITQRNLAIQPTIKVRPGFSVNVLVTRDMVLAPYDRESARVGTSQ